ncbi:MAG TPA: phosphoribosylformylglycinamidine synthase [Planctomycetes bacterium]|nr:phosphoribosylformylglycinamidine synthase [Planctomycetota bacterium]
MAHRIHVRAAGADTRARVRKAAIARLFPGAAVGDLRLVDNYTVAKDLPPDACERVRAMLTHPVIEEGAADRPLLPPRFDWSFEIAFLPGVTDNAGRTAREAIGDLLKTPFAPGEDVYSSQTTFLAGRLSRAEVEAIAGAFANPLIHHIEIRTAEEWRAGAAVPYIPRVTLPEPAEVCTVDLDIPEDELLRLGREGIPDPRGGRRGPLALDRESLLAIRAYFRRCGRMPADIELESIAQTWSEHCKHTIFAAALDEIEDGLYKTYIKGATEKIRAAKGDGDFCVSVFRDNSGAIAFDDEYLVTDKVETHNSPCALDPFGGAITGIVGVNRDAIGCGLGAKPIANRYGFCFAPPDDDRPLFRDAACTQPLLPPRRIMDGVIEGVNAGGNCSGIPTPQGFVCFDPRYRGKPLVFVGTVGLMPRASAGRPSHRKAARPGDVIVMAGGRVGRDGIHGATFSSEALSAGSPAAAVQIGDPITQKKLSDAIVKEARDAGLYRSITDNGAGGLSCSVAEMARECGGCVVELDRVPLKYPGLEPWQIWISESQERMTLAVPPDKLDAFTDLMARRGVEAAAIGRFEASGRCRVRWHGAVVMDVDLGFLHDGLPRKTLASKAPPQPAPDEPDALPEDLGAALLGVMARPNVASYAFISRQYDHEVQGGAVLKPLAGRGEVNARATVMQPLLDRRRGIVLSQALFPSYGDLDPYAMAACAVDAAVRQAIAAGGTLDRLALLDNTCWCSPYEPERLWQLKEAIRACRDFAVAFGTPFISGKDSMFNDFSGFASGGAPVAISVPPTILISSLGVVEDVARCVSPDFKTAGDLIYVLGATRAELGGSEFLAWWGAARRGRPYAGSVAPVPSARSVSLYRAYERAVAAGLVTSAEAPGTGGLGVALARQAVAGGLGCTVDLAALPEAGRLTDAELLFSETPGRIVCTVAPGARGAFEECLRGEDAACAGRVTEDGNVAVMRGAAAVARASVARLAEAYRRTFEGF